MGSAAGGRDGTNIVDRGLKVLFFGVFFAIFRCSVFFPLPPPPWKFFCRRPCLYVRVCFVHFRRVRDSEFRTFSDAFLLAEIRLKNVHLDICCRCTVKEVAAYYR